MRGVVLWEGLSRINGEPIVVIATLSSANVKTGNMVQTWILHRDESPIEAINTGSDESVCGSCPLRGIVEEGRNRSRGCYVTVRNAPYQVWTSYKAGKYPQLDSVRSELAGLLCGRSLRLGSYGDPAAVPKSAWNWMMKHCTGGRSGYTHQWRDPRFQFWRKYIMASTHSDAENRDAHSMGWRTFRTLRADETTSADEVFCPASPDGKASRTVTCETCLACDGRKSGSARKSIAIHIHGSPAVLHSAARMTQV